MTCPHGDELECLECEYAWVPDARFESNPVTASYEVLAAGVRKVDGMLLDAFTASAIVAVAEKLNPVNRARLEAMPLERAVRIVWKLAK